MEYLVTGKETRKKAVKYPKDVQIAAELIAEMKEKNRKMAIAIIKSMKKQEQEETKQHIE